MPEPVCNGGTRPGRLVVRLATTAAEVEAAQRLRYRVFAEECGAIVPSMEAGLDRDVFDDACEHLVLWDVATGEAIGTYRVLSQDRARRLGGFYSAGEFDLGALPGLANLVEVGRSCVDPRHRTGVAVATLLGGLAALVRARGWQYVIGCASVPVPLRGRRVGGTEPLLVVANHVSWLDAYVLNALYEARFVAKSETGSWPVVGTIAHAFDSLFIVRGSFRDAARVKDRVAAALRAGERVVVFPEATTTDGTRLREFRAAMFQDDTFVASLLRVLCDRSLRVQVRFGPLLPVAAGTRRDLAAAAHAFVADALRIPGAAVRPQPRAASRAWPDLARATGS